MKNEKKIKLIITDHTGHSTFELELDEAADKITEQVSRFGKFAYFDDKPMDLTNTKDEVATRNLVAHSLEGTEEVVLTGALVGGATYHNLRNSKGRFVSRRSYLAKKVAVKGGFTSSPLSRVIDSELRPHIIVSFSGRKTNRQLKVVFSNYKNAIRKLRPHRRAIADMIVRGLSNA